MIEGDEGVHVVGMGVDERADGLVALGHERPAVQQVAGRDERCQVDVDRGDPGRDDRVDGGGEARGTGRVAVERQRIDLGDAHAHRPG